MRGMNGRLQQKRQEEEEVMVIGATPSPPGSPNLDAKKTSPTKENEIIHLEDDEDEQQAQGRDWKPRKKLLYIDHPPTERLLVDEALAHSRQRINAPMKPLVSRVDLQERLKEKEVEKFSGSEGYFRVLW